MKRLIAAILILVALTTLIGCADILEGYSMSESPYFVLQPERQPEERIEISNYEELTEEVFNLITEHEISGRMLATSYDGDIEADVRRVCREIYSHDPLVAYAISDIAGGVTRFVPNYEVDINVEYKRTKRQVDSIVKVPTGPYLRSELFTIMSEYRDVAVIRTALKVTKEYLIELAREIYYQNPRRIMMLPVIAVEEFPLIKGEKILELRFGYSEQASILSQHREILDYYLNRGMGLALGDTYPEILLSLVENLVDASVFDWGAAMAIGMHGVQNSATTAFGAMINGRAAGEGFAMALKALCDEMGFDCIVVLGHLDSRLGTLVHAWNIVSIDGENYHIDVSMCIDEDMETAFFKTDEDFLKHYTWDMTVTPRCEGTLTYEDIVGSAEEEDDEDDENEAASEQAGDEAVDGQPESGVGTVETPDELDDEIAH